MAMPTRSSGPKYYHQLVVALVAASVSAVAIYTVRVIEAQTWRYLFLIWNLTLAWIPLLVAWWLRHHLAKNNWMGWRAVVLTLLWLGFLPNSFYILTDFIHLHATGEIGLLYDVVLFTAFAFNGLILGFFSLYIVHRELLKRNGSVFSHTAVGLILFLCSFAIYLGRYLRWNTWDILFNPAGILFDVSDRFINPVAFPRTFTTTASFFVLLGMMYLTGFTAADVLRHHKAD